MIRIIKADGEEKQFLAEVEKRAGVYYSAKSRQLHRPQEKFGITASLFAGLYYERRDLKSS